MFQGLAVYTMRNLLYDPKLSMVEQLADAVPLAHSC